MKTTNRVILVGGFHEVIDLCESCGVDIAGIIDNRLQGSYRGHSVLGGDEDAEALYNKYGDVPLLVTPDEPGVRKSLVDRYSALGFRFASGVHPLASVSPSADLGTGVIVHTFAHVSTDAHVGDFVRVNACANVMHDCVVGDFTTVAPNAVLLGRVTVGESSYIGSNATILPDVRVGEGSVVGAGAVVTKDVPDGVTVAGNPARKLSG
jgi:sugar O-acyltransferase (sialic acid O-acetyltransferase NeuD family)